MDGSAGQTGDTMTNALLLTLIEGSERVWGENWSIHARGCRNTTLRNVEWVVDIDTVRDGVITAFGDFMEGSLDDGVKEYSRYLRICPCALKVIAAQNGVVYHGVEA